MKIAWIWDNGIESPSYYMKDKTAYNWHTDEPYQKSHWISSDLAIATNNITFLYDNGYFINWMDLINNNKQLPDLDLDLIFFTCERNGLDNEWCHLINVDNLRKKYPTAKIIGMIKELGKNFTGHIKPHRISKRFEFLNSCDGVVAMFANKAVQTDLLELEKNINFEIKTMTPIQNVNLFYDKFYSNEKENSIFVYQPNRLQSSGRTYEFAKYISNKYNLKLVTKPSNSNFYHLSAKDFINLWSPCLYHFNLDPLHTQQGHQCIQVANAGCINIGGNNESHKILFPETATCDETILEQKFHEYFTNEDKRAEVLLNAWNNLNKHYSFNNSRENINTLIKEIYEN
jgi:hypothetical protein